jgi:preprotein translocase subunit SecB
MQYFLKHAKVFYTYKLHTTHVYKIIQTQNFKTKFKHTKNLKCAKIFLPNIRECVGETVRKSEIILEAFRNGGIVVTTGGA